MEAFANRIHRWRLDRGLLQKQAAAVFGVPTGTYRTWEKGSRTPKELSLVEIERRMAAQGEHHGI